MLEVILVDDEKPARDRLRLLLEELDAEIRVTGEAANGKEAVEIIRKNRPDLIFLDIQMPVLDGFDVVDLLGDSLPPVIFVTAYDEYAIQAFEVHAVDYLLKPVRKERLERALSRVQDDRANLGKADPDRSDLEERSVRGSGSGQSDLEQSGLKRSESEQPERKQPEPGQSGLNPSESDETDTAGPSTIQSGTGGESEVGSNPSDSIQKMLEHHFSGHSSSFLKVPVNHKQEILLLEHEKILYFKADGKLTWAVTDTRKYQADFTLNKLERRLKQHAFFRIHRSTLVNLNAIKKLEPWFKDGLVVILTNGTELEISRRRVAELKKVLGM